MKTKLFFISNYYICLIFTFWGCQSNPFEPKADDFKVKSFISNIKSYNVNADYNEDVIPTDTTSTIKPYVAVQSWVVKGKDILMSITVPDDTEELYFGAVNSQAEYMGLNFSKQNQTAIKGYYRLKLNNLRKSNTASNDLQNYQVVLSSNENIQLNKFDLIVGCKTATGISNTTSVPVDVISIAPYQKNLKVGFRPLSGYTYTIKITTPTGDQITYSYNKNTGSETFDISQSANSTLSYDSGLDFKWVDFSDPQFGRYTLTATIQIDLSEGSQYIYLLIAIITEGMIDQVDLNANIQQTGPSSAVGTASVGFKYFDELKNITANIIAYRPVNYEMLNPTSINCKNELLSIVPENKEEIPGVGLRACQNCIINFLFSKITLEVINKDYSSDEIYFYLKGYGSAGYEYYIWDDRNYNKLLLFGNQEIEIIMPSFQNNHTSRDIWITTDIISQDTYNLTFFVMDNLGNVLSEDNVIFYPVNLSILSIRGINTNIQLREFGHTWITINNNNSKTSYGFWPKSGGDPFDFIGIKEEYGIILSQSGDFDNSKISYYDFTHDFYIYSTSLQAFYSYKETIDNNEMLWNLSYNCATFATTSVNIIGINIPILNWPNEVEKWINDFEANN